jgi:uncharacterized protein (TIGR02145 family)
MAENLNYNASGSKCYDNQDSYCDTYGRLYNWETAKTACPSGWHLPSDDEWDVLVNSVGGSSTTGRHLKATSGWYSDGYSNGNGLDSFGFSALPGGYGDSGSFRNVGNVGSWWSSTEYDSSSAYGRNMGGGGIVLWGSSYKSTLLSVRCLTGLVGTW